MRKFICSFSNKLPLLLLTQTFNNSRGFYRVVILYSFNYQFLYSFTYLLLHSFIYIFIHSFNFLFHHSFNDLVHLPTSICPLLNKPPALAAPLKGAWNGSLYWKLPFYNCKNTFSNWGKRWTEAVSLDFCKKTYTFHQNSNREVDKYVQ